MTVLKTNRYTGNMYRAGVVLACALMGLTGCSQTVQEELPGPPPPPPPAPAAQQSQTYDYTHSVRTPARSRLTRKFVVALVRFGGDRAPDDPSVPYGSGTAGAPAEGSTNINIHIQNAPGDQLVSAELPLSMSARDRAFLQNKLMESGSFVVVERERILDIIRELNFNQTRYVNPATAVEPGQLMGVQYLIEASVGENLDLTLKGTEAPPPSYKDGNPTLMDRLFKPGHADQWRQFLALRKHLYEQSRRQQKQELNRCGVYLAMYSVRTGEMVADAFGLGSNSLMAIEDAVEELVLQCQRIPNPPRIAAIDRDRVFLDLGEADRVKPGQVFRYLTPGREIRNAAGQTIGTTDEEGGELEIVKVEPLMSVARVIRKVADPVVGGVVEPLE